MGYGLGDEWELGPSANCRVVLERKEGGIRDGVKTTRAQARSWDISPKAGDSLNMRSCCPAEEAEGQTYLEATSAHFGKRQGRHL